ncbi:MAG: flagellar basal body rod protein FlgC [Planctomycetaceae bacterium]|nr:flagellar basal body rod protein FlgC [Planctomycetaceae bacterium]MCP4464058.1 flagellar basal body rod protein FlgC [Planctomycetaceae bacterium]MDG1808166.1 flagellar basal body rod protein FlgC [Pirellulaceae bacterium]MDG2103837.1 flagellar basal body rod protein FlgC [Pirellulaceae bacterium]
MFNSSFATIDVSASGLSAERYRMEVIANNIANANSTRTPEGGPYRRQQVVFAAQQASMLAASGGNATDRMNGVSVVGVQQDPSNLQMVYNPGHPDADGEGMVAMPNVRIPYEMVDMITASRSYEANLRSIRSFRQMIQQTLTLLRGQS